MAQYSTRRFHNHSTHCANSPECFTHLKRDHERSVIIANECVDSAGNSVLLFDFHGDVEALIGFIVGVFRHVDLNVHLGEKTQSLMQHQLLHIHALSNHGCIEKRTGEKAKHSSTAYVFIIDVFKGESRLLCYYLLAYLLALHSSSIHTLCCTNFFIYLQVGI